MSASPHRLPPPSARERGRGRRARLRWLLVLLLTSVSRCGGIAVIDSDEEPTPESCYDDLSCCEAAIALFDEKCPRADGVARLCAIETVPDSCTPFLGEVYRCIVQNPDRIICDAGVPRLECGTCTSELEATGEPCGQSGSSCTP